MKFRSRLLLAITSLLTANFSWADYRAFDLRIFDPEVGTERVVRSRFDDIQYPTYYPLNRGEFIEIKSSWRCWGNTGGFKPICPSPEERSGQSEDSSAEPKTSSTSPPPA